MRTQQYDDRMTKERLTVTVDAEVAEAATRAVAEGRAPSVSAWVNDALIRHAEHAQRLRALDEAVGAHEAEFGAFTEEELEAQRAADAAAAASVRARRRARR